MSLEQAQELAERIAPGRFDINSNSYADAVALDFIEVLVEKIERLEAIVKILNKKEK